MTTAQWQRVKAVYEDLAERAAAEQPALLAAACTDDAAVRAEVAALLQLQPQAAAFLEQPPLVAALPSQENHSGKQIGAYRLLRELGRGGMGAVYLAERTDGTFDQQVAIKLVWPGPDSIGIRSRFHQERQILAQLNHPNIARLLDGGTTDDGWPYLVMEYVAGQPITDYCHEHRLSLTARLQLFLTVCAAVTHAHSRLVIHRDLKPSNIFVTDDGQVKLLDFGIAKLLKADAADETPGLTRTGMQLLTPEYASPEQLRSSDVTTATDVYSLGVVLYELLTGTRPYRFKTPALAEIVQTICEYEPEPPSARVKQSAAHTAARVPHPGTLAAQLRGDLDQIVLKALRKEPERRYQSVEQLSDDLRRYFAGQPVTARRGSLRYRAQKFVKRNKVGVVVTVLVAVFLLVGAIVNVRQRRQERWLSYVADMRQAGQAWADGNLVRMSDLLDQHRSGAPNGADEWRGFEWAMLWKLLHREQFSLQRTSYVYTVSYTPDGQRIFIIDREGQITTWEAATGRPLGTFSSEADLGAGLFAIGANKVAASGDKGVRVRDLNTGRALFEVRDRAINTMMLSSDGRLLALALPDSTVQLLDATTGQLLQTTAKVGDTIRTIVFSPDGKLLAIGSATGKLHLWDVRAGRQYAAFDIQAKDATLRTIFAPTFSADGKLLYTGARDGRVREWDVPGRRLRRSWVAHNDLVDGLALTRDGRLLATSGNDTTVRLWDTATMRELATVTNEAPVAFLVFSPDDRTLAGSCMRQHRAKVWDVQELLSSPLVIKHDCQVRSIAFNRRGDRLAIGDFCGKIKLQELATGRQTIIRPAPLCQIVNYIAFSADAQRMAEFCDSGNAPAVVNVRDAESGKLITALPNAAGPVVFSPDDKTLLMRGEHSHLKLWDMMTGQARLIDLKKSAPWWPAADLSPDGRRAVIGWADGTVKVFDLTTGQQTLELAGHNAQVDQAHYSPDGRMIATACWDYTARLWDAQTGRELHRLNHGGSVYAVAFSPDGKHLAAAGEDRMVYLWDTATGLEMTTLKGHTRQIYALAFSPDGRTLASGSLDGTVRLWRAASEQEVQPRIRSRP